MTHLSRLLGTKTLLKFATLLSVIISINGVAVSNQRPKAEEEPIFREYRGIRIDWLADDVRKKLGDPANKGDEQDIYSFGEKESAQIVYDKATHKVVTISVDFSSGAAGLPTPQQVLGADCETKPDGSKYKMVRYPKAGYWVSYYRGGGDSPMVTVTLQKMN